MGKEVLESVAIELEQAESEEFHFTEANVEPRFIYRKVVALENAIDFDLLQLQSYLLTTVLRSNIPGGLAGPLRYEHFIARSFDVNVVPLDSRHIELVFEATADSGVSLRELQSRWVFRGGSTQT